jgi:hypothetical protein
MNSRVILSFAVIAVLASRPVFGEDQADIVWKSFLGKKAPVSVSTPATGFWAEKYPFDSSAFGKVRGHCPAASMSGSGIMVYARQLNPQVLAALERINESLASHSDMTQSYVNLFDSKGAQFGGYTADEVSARIAELQKIAADHKLTHLSIGIAANGSDGHAARCGLDKTHDLVVVFLKANPDPKKPALVSAYRAFHSDDLTREKLDELVTFLDQAMSVQ